MQTSELRFGDIMAGLGSVIRSNAGLVLLATALIAMIDTVFDMTSDKATSAGLGMFASVAISVFGQYHFVEALLPGYRAGTASRKRRYGSLFAAGFLGGLGGALGVVLLVVPGLYLAARWSISTPFIVAEDQASTQSLKSSWHATQDSGWTIFLVLLTLSMAGLAVFATATVIATLAGKQDNALVQSLLTNILVGLWLVGGWCLSVAIFQRLNPASGTYEAVFD